jgi:hypothetical protein
VPQITVELTESLYESLRIVLVGQNFNPAFAGNFISPSKMEAARSVIDSVTTAAINGNISERLRVTLLDAATKLVAALQRPEDTITKLAYQVL